MQHSKAEGEPSAPYNIGPNRYAASRLETALYVVATPIGNLGDVTVRALATLAAARIIACEDTRVTRRLLTHFGIQTPLVAYHEHNAAEMRPRLLAHLAQGEPVALVSDAGTPLISDPGYKLVEAAREAGHRVVPIPGASALTAALCAAGLPTDTVLFDGFLPQKGGARRDRLQTLAVIPATLVFYESGPRLAASLADMADVLGDRPASICRELTKTFEEFRRAPLAELAAHYALEGAPKGEIVVVVGPPLPQAAPDGDDLDAALKTALAAMSLKDAVAMVAEATGQPRRLLYQRALDLTRVP